MVVRTVAELQLLLSQYREAKQCIALVPTMGNLHAGHIELVKIARLNADKTVASIFVNPRQFNQQSDFDAYSRTEYDDVEALNASSIDAIFIPSTSEIYPPKATDEIKAGYLAKGLCGDFREGHFDGVATVLTRLFTIIKPDIAVFGQKDYQQLCIVRQLVQSLGIDTTIIDVPTVRTPEGLALSSRNNRLSPSQMQQAPLLYRTLCNAKSAIRNGADLDTTVTNALAELTSAGFRPEYMSVRKPNTLEYPVNAQDLPLIILTAVWLGDTRLIDNIFVE